NHLPAIQLAFNSYTTTQSDYITPVYYKLADSSQERVETMDLVHLNLLSKTQSNVMRLTCAGALSNGDMTDAPRSYRPNLTQINRILGEIGYIRN
ncbi:MAG: hypothetical protein R3254_10410, partial [Thiomicrorhabdus sp.]|nr:hypothetical protein [Thiomicrorhabdus sp.]